LLQHRRSMALVKLNGGQRLAAKTASTAFPAMVRGPVAVPAGSPRQTDDNGRVRSPADSANATVRRIVDLITERGLTAGDHLPTVRELSKRWRVSPNVVRDMLVRAQMIGLVEIKPRSGVIVRSLDYTPLVETLSQTLPVSVGQRDPNLVDLWHARAVIETETAANAARRRLTEDLQSLRQTMADMRSLVGDRARFIEADECFHLTIARAAGNPVLEILLDALLKVSRPHRLRFVPDRANTDDTFATHEAIYNAIADGNMKEARRAMGEHCLKRARNLMRLPETPAMSDEEV
jgi:GntR family transcriptional regulator, transcriptional repressor for pyruvate dehydrogenase complex